MRDASRAGDAAPEAMRAYWDARARENAMYFIHSELDYADPDTAAFWSSGGETLDRTLGLVGASLRPTDEVVEIGCGIGRVTRHLAARARHVVGIDVSTEMVERGRRLLSDLANVSLLVGTGRDLAGVADDAVDLVYSFIVFQHIPDPAVTCNYIREIGRVLRPGGRTVFQVSEHPEVHRPDLHAEDRGLRAAMARAGGRRPRGCRSPQWLGSAMPRDDLLAALSDGGLVLSSTAGDGTQYCVVHAIKAAGPPGES